MVKCRYSISQEETAQATTLYWQRRCKYSVSKISAQYWQ